MRQLKEQNAQQAQATAAAGSSSGSFAPMPLAPAISAEQMDIFRDSVVFTPPPEAQHAHLVKTGVQMGANVEVSPERPAYSPLSDNGGAER